MRLSRSGIKKSTESVRSTNGKQRYDAVAGRTRGDCTYQVDARQLCCAIYRVHCTAHYVSRILFHFCRAANIYGDGRQRRQFQFKRTLNMTVTSSSQSPSPPDSLPSPLPEYLQQFEQLLPPKREYKIPKLHWKIEDLETTGAERVILHCTSPVKLLKDCIVAIFDLLYTAESCPTQCVRRLCPYLTCCLRSIVWD